MQDLKSIFAIDNNTSYAAGNFGTILKSTNGGNSWFSQSNGSTMNLYYVFFINSSTGWISGDNGAFPNTGYIYKTINGGNNWFQLSTRDFGISSIYFVNELTGWICGTNWFGNSRRINKTTDGGYIWVDQNAGGQWNPLSSIFFLNANTGWVAGSEVIKTTNSGLNWYSQPNSGGNSINFKDAETGVTAGNDGTIKITTNGGFNWNNDISGTNNHLYSVHYSSDGVMCAVGEKGTIICNTNLVGIKELNKNIPQNYLLHQNYPNPFNPSTNIKFDIPKNEFVTLKVIDLLGQEVAILVNEKLSAGTYEVGWNASGYPSGVYFYRLQIDNFAKVNKMILAK